VPPVDEQADGAPEAAAAKPIIPEVDPDIERLLAEEEEIERRTRDPHEAPHFRRDPD
jgi:small subunit ribosomal protein S3